MESEAEKEDENENIHDLLHEKEENFQTKEMSPSWHTFITYHVLPISSNWSLEDLTK